MNLTENDLFLISSQGRLNYSISSSNLDAFSINEYNSLARSYDFPLLGKETDDKWLFSQEYKNFDLLNFLLSKCENAAEKSRIYDEYALIEKYNLIDVFRYLKYIKDSVSKNGMFLGVGRGSSVSLYSLYLLGIHKIDSIKYDLDYFEFFKINSNNSK